MENISKRVIDILKKGSTKWGISLSTLREKYLNKLKLEKEAYPNIPDEELEDRVVLMLKGEYTGRARSKATLQTGFFIGDTFSYDFNGRLRREADSKKAENFNEAKLLGLINDAGEVVDPRPTITAFGKETKNPGFNKPLKYDWRRRIYGIFNYQNTWEYGMLNLRGQAAKNYKVKYFTPCQFLAIDRGLDAGYLTLNQSKYTEFQQINPEWNVDEVLMETIKEDIVSFENLEKHYEDTKDAWDAYVFVRGTVQEGINTNPPRITIMRIGDPNPDSWSEDIVTCFVPKGWDINFIEYSKVIVLGRLRKTKSRRFASEEGEDEERLVMNVYGVYPLPGHTRTKGIKDLSSLEIKYGWKNI